MTQDNRLLIYWVEISQKAVDQRLWHGQCDPLRCSENISFRNRGICCENLTSRQVKLRIDIRISKHCQNPWCESRSEEWIEWIQFWLGIRFNLNAAKRSVLSAHKTEKSLQPRLIESLNCPNEVRGVGASPQVVCLLGFESIRQTWNVKDQPLEVSRFFSLSQL